MSQFLSITSFRNDGKNTDFKNQSRCKMKAIFLIALRGGESERKKSGEKKTTQNNE